METGWPSGPFPTFGRGSAGKRFCAKIKHVKERRAESVARRPDDICCIIYLRYNLATESFIMTEGFWPGRIGVVLQTGKISGDAVEAPTLRAQEDEAGDGFWIGHNYFSGARR